VKGVLTLGRIVMKAYAINNYSENISCYDQDQRDKSRGKKRTPINGCPPFPLFKPSTLFILRESTESYGGKYSKKELSTVPTSKLFALSDSALVAGLERLRGKERKIQLDILLYIIELEKRKLYLPRGYNSLFEFCTKHLGYSRAGAYRRIQASKCIGRFPKIANLLITGDLNISLLSLISGVLTKENINNILPLVSGKSYRDAEIAIVMYKPIETITRDKVKPVCVLKKKLSQNIGNDTGSKNKAICLNVETKHRNCHNINTNKTDTHLNTETNNAKGANKEEIELKQKFKLEFMVDPEFMQKLERIKAGLSRKHPEGVNFEMLFNIVMDEYLNRHSPKKRIEGREKREVKRQKEALDCGEGKPKLTNPATNKLPRSYKQRSRAIPAAVRDKVFARDGGKCTFVGENGKRCDSSWNLEIDHIVPFAKGGDNSPGNLRLLCAKHNLMEAERVYGEDFMKKYKKE
jgi:5-methylcytosine-specific restriction endonuclease McrA